MTKTPPEYAPIPIGIIFDHKINKSVLSTYTKLRSLAWSNGFNKTSPIPLDQVLAIIELERRQYFYNVKMLKQQGWLKTTTPKKDTVIFEFPVQKIAPKLINKLLNIKPDFELETLINQDAEKRTVLVQELVNKGIHKGIAERLILQHGFETVTRYINFYYWQRYKTRIPYNSPGWLVKAIQESWEDTADFNPEMLFCDECTHPQHDHKSTCSQYKNKWQRDRELYPDTDNEEAEPESEPPDSLLDPKDFQGKPISENPLEAWRYILSQLQTDMAKATFDTWVRDTWVYDFSKNTLTIATHNAYGREWLEARLTSTVQRLITGIMNTQIEIAFTTIHLETETQKEK